MAVIETVNLTKYYGKNRGMKDVNIKVEEGEIFGFIGPNGSGKSTFIRTILNFLYPTSGSGTILGLDIEKESDQLKKYVGYVPSEVKYYEEVTASDIIDYSASFYPESDSLYIEKLTTELKVDMQKKMGELSLGNKKKVAIVQALLGNPKLLILDEPTSGLDPLIQKKLFAILRAEKTKGNTVFLSSHNLSEVESLCDRVAIIREGEIVDTIELEKVKKQFGLIIELEGDFEKKDILEISENIIEEEKDRYVISYGEDINKFLLWAKDRDFKKLFIKEQNLEDAFMKYYSEKGVGRDEHA